MHRRLIALATLLAKATHPASAHAALDTGPPHFSTGNAGRRKSRGSIAATVFSLCVLPVAVALTMVTSPSVNAAEITFIETLKQGTGGVNGMSGASDVATSPDGRHVYVAAYNGGGSVAIYSRNQSTGQLTYVGYVTNSAGGPTITAAFAVEVSRDGKNVYAGSPSSNNVAAFSRDANTGALTFVANYHGPDLGLQSAGVVSLSISPDDKSVYSITGSMDGLVVFSRNSSDGRLTLVEEHRDGVNGNLLGQAYSPTHSPINNMAVSADNAFVYVSATDDNAVSVFARNSLTGALTLASTVVDGAGGVDGIQGASSLVLSPDNQFLYVSGQLEDSVAIFSRNTATGALTYVGKRTQGSDGISTLDGARSLAVSPDGRYVYVSANISNAITVFNRNAVTGDLSLATSVTQGTGGVDGIGSVSGMVTDPLSRHLYAAGQTAGSIAVFSLPVPAVVLSTTAHTVDENDPSILLDTGLQVFDADDPNLASASITIASGFIAGDTLSVTPQGNISTSYDAATGILTLTGSDTLAAYQAVLRTVRFQTSDDPSLNSGQTATKTVAFRVHDGINESAAAVVTITVNGSSGPPSYTLNYTAGANGSISGNASQTVIAGGSGSAVSAVPATGYHFAQWSDASTANPRTDTNVNADLSVSSSFAINMYAVTASASGNGSIGPATVDVAHGGTTAFSVVPGSGASLLQVQGCGGTLSGNTFTTGPITSACAVTATFGANEVVVSATAGTGGSITPASVVVEQGGTATFTLAPQAGYSITGVAGCDGTLSGNTYTVAAVTGACTVTASFGIHTPIFTPSAPADRDINALSLMTALPQDMAPQAADHQGNALEVSLVGGRTHFATGRHVLTWRAVTAQGGEGTVQQVLRIWPTVSFSPDQTLGGQAGNFDFFRIALNGRAPVYPLTVNYTVSGDAEGTDLQNGTVVFNDGEIEKSVGFAVLSSMANGSPDRQVQLTLDEALNRGSNRPLTITLSALNQAPAVKLSAWQGGEQRPSIAKDAGPATIAAEIRDPNTNDTHTLQWSGPSGVSFEVTDDGIVIQPGSLAVGVHRFELTTTDSGNPPQVTRSTIDLAVVATTPAVPAGANGWLPNGLPDHPDYAPRESNVLPERAGELSQYLMESDPGTQLALGAYSILHGQHQSELPGSSVGGNTLPNDTVANHGGYFDFVVSNLPRAGESVSVVVPQRAAIPPNPQYRKYDPTTRRWMTFVEDTNNQLASAPGANGFCPPPASEAYRAGLNTGDWCVRLTIRDGGPNDTDGRVDGSVADPGGVGTLSNVVVTGQAGGRSGGGSFDLWMVFATVILAFARRFRQRAGWVAAAAALATVSTSASAEQAGNWYGGAQIGQARSDVSASKLTQQLAQQGHDATVRLSDTTRSAWRIHAGYQWDLAVANVGIEAGYVDLGEVGASFSGPVANVDSFLAAANRLHPASADGYDLSVVARHEFNSRFGLSARVGALRWDNRITTRNLDGAAVRRNDHGIDAAFGIGASAKLNDRWSVTAEATRYGVSGDDIDFLAAGLVYRW